MKSVYNKIVRAAPVQTITVDSISDVVLTNPANRDVMIYNNNMWTNSRVSYTELTNQPTILTTLDSLTDVTISNPVNNNFLKYNGQWVNGNIQYSDISNAPTIPSSINDLSDVTITNPQNDNTFIYSSGQWINKRQYNYLTNFAIVTGNVVAQPNYIYTVVAGILEMPSSSGTGNIILAILDGGLIYFPNGVVLYHQGASTNFYLDSLNQKCIVEFESYSGNSWILKSFSGRLVKSTTQKGLCNNEFNDLTDLNINTPDNDQYIGYDSNTSKYINRIFYNEYNEVINVTNGAVVAQYNKLYICNNGAVSMPAVQDGRTIKIINLSGPTALVDFTNKILWHYTNLFNISLQCSDAGHIEFVGLNNAWQVKSMTGRWINSATGLGLAATQINDIRGVSITAPSSGQFLSFDGTNWTNTTLERCHPTSELFIGGVGTTFQITLTTVNVWYRFSHATTILNNPSANGVFARNNANLLQWTYTGTNSKYYHSAFSISSASNDAGDNFEVAYFVNNVLLAGSQFSVDYANNNRFTSTAFHKVLLLNTNDVIDVRIRNISANGKVITINNVNLLAMACCSLN